MSGLLLLGGRWRCFHIVGEPGQTLEQTFSRSRARWHDVPDLVLELVELQGISNFLWFHGVSDVLLVGEYKEKTVLHFSVVDDAVKLLLGLLDSGPVGRVNDKDQTLCAAKVVSPERSNLVLATDVPHVEFNVLVGNRLDVESDGRNGRHVLAELELVQDGCLSSGIETQHEKSHLL